jgi:hypothetical protein
MDFMFPTWRYNFLCGFCSLQFLNFINGKTRVF